MLSTAQIKTFKCDGVLLLEGLVPPAQLDDWRAQAWAELGCSPADRASWPVAGLHPNDRWATVAPNVSQLPELHEIVEQLGGPGVFSDGGTIGRC